MCKTCEGPLPVEIATAAERLEELMGKKKKGMMIEKTECGEGDG